MKTTKLNVNKNTLSNGLQVVTEPMPAVRSVSMGVWLRTGSRHEREDQNGIVHFLEHMVFKGTQRRTGEEIARAADAIGGHLDAFTSKEFTCFSIKVVDEHLPRAFDILADLVKNPLLRSSDIAKESRVIQEEIKMVEDTPDDLVHEIFSKSYWPHHSLGRPILGTRATVGAFNQRRLRDFFKRHYVPGNMLITAAGNLAHSQVVDLAEEQFGKLSRGKVTGEGPIPIAHPHASYRRKKELEQTHICLGTPAYPYSHKKRFASYVLNTILGGGMSSRLFQHIREKHGLVYAVFSGLSAYRDAGILSVYAGTAPANARKVVSLIVEEFKNLKNNTIPAEELQRAKDYLKGNLLLGLESTTSRMANLARQELYYGRCITLDEVAAQIDAVTREDVVEVARELFQSERIAVTVLGPRRGFTISRDQLDC
ncbi:MAG: insulinase family protein [Acidobacteria bacterium]|nr:MAG: insulinase family protein [Acidobacteriota bacterium]